MSNILQIIVAALLGVLSVFQPHRSHRQKPEGPPQVPVPTQPGSESVDRGNAAAGDAGEL